MLQEAVAQQPSYILPVVVTLVRHFFLQDRPNGNHGRKRIAEKQKLKKECLTEGACARGQNNGRNPCDLDDGCQYLKYPQIGKRQKSNPSVTWCEQHVPVGPQHVQQSLLPSCSLPPK